MEGVLGRHSPFAFRQAPIVLVLLSSGPAKISPKQGREEEIKERVRDEW